MTIPNLLSLRRIAASPVLGYFVLREKYSLALGLFALTGVSDVVGLLDSALIVTLDLIQPLYSCKQLDD